LGLREGHDVIDSPISGPNGTLSRIVHSAADQTGTTQDPKLVVEHSSPEGAPLAPTALLVEGESDPPYIFDATPEFSAIYDDTSGDSAIHYRIQVSTSSSFSTVYWDSGTTTMATTTVGNRSPDLSYGGSTLASITTYYWRIKFSDDDGNTGAWSTATSTFVLSAESGPVYGALVENGDFRKYVYTSEEYWEVTDRFGTVYTFGATSTARQHKSGQLTTTFKWMLEEIRDLNDNYISYEYFQDKGQIYPSRITYTGHDSTDGPFAISFDRTFNPDIATSSATGFPVKTDYKISAIHAHINGDLVRSYALGYANGHHSVNLLLSSVTESGRDESGATTTLPASTFEYNSGFTPSWSLDSQFATSSIDIFIETNTCSGGLGWIDRGTRAFDANGDGYADMMTARTGNYTLDFNNSNMGWTSSGWSLPFNFVDGAGEDIGARLIDANGDALPDQFLQETAIGTSTHLHNGSGWTSTTSYQVPPHLSDVRFGDINGDGLTDLIDNHDATRRAYINRGNNTGWEEDTDYVVPADFYEEGSWVMDMNKDGLDDLVVSVGTSTGSVSKVYLNKGDGTGWEHSANYVFEDGLVDTGADTGNRLADVNNDGYPDMVQSLTNG
jgi:FG-GAP-like repeat/Salmonella virulence plasmid 65kDa B protein